MKHNTDQEAGMMNETMMLAGLGTAVLALIGVPLTLMGRLEYGIAGALCMAPFAGFMLALTFVAR